MREPTAKLFTTGGSQAVRLPAEFRFEDATEVYIRRDEATGDVILSVHAPTNWTSFMKRRSRIGPAVPDEYLQPAERAQSEQTRDPFEGWQD